MKTSIIIRTKNESQFIGTVLDKLATQTEKDFEVIVVDSGSEDKTLEIVNSYKDKLNLKLFNIPPEKFTYPYALNYGCKNALGKFLVFVSGHSVPLNEHWLKAGLDDFENDNVGGVYGPVYPLKNASFWEKLLYGASNIIKRKKKVIKRAGMGVGGNTNAIIPQNLWVKYHFDEKNYWDGGEDGDWAKHFFDEGYVMIFEPKFAIFHSHGFGLVRFIKQYIHWYKLAKRFTKNDNS